MTLRQNYFLQCSPFGEVDLFGPRGTSVLFPLLRMLSWREVGVVDPEANLFFTVLFCVKSIFWTPRHEFISYSALFWWSRSFWPQDTNCCFPLMWVLSCRWSRCCRPRGKFIFYSALLCGVDLLDPEARIYFLQCSSFLVKPIFLTSRHIYSPWITFDIRTLGMKLCLQMIHGYGFYVFLLSVT